MPTKIWIILCKVSIPQMQKYLTERFVTKLNYISHGATQHVVELFIGNSWRNKRIVLIIINPSFSEHVNYYGNFGGNYYACSITFLQLKRQQMQEDAGRDVEGEEEEN